MKRSTLVATVAVDLARRGERVDRLPAAIAEWLDGQKWAGALFDRRGWDLRRFVSDVSKVFGQHANRVAKILEAGSTCPMCRGSLEAAPDGGAWVQCFECNYRRG
jgi:hypothetical protein